MNKITLLLVSSLLGLAACSPTKQAASAGAEIDNSCSSGIVNGKSVKKSDPLAKKVVLLMMVDKDKNYSTCTGTPIADDVILTAAHCVKEAVVVSAIFKTALCENDQPKKEEFIIASDWKYHSKYEGLGGNDVAIVRLSRSIPADYQISKVYDGVAPITSTSVTLVGFGHTSETDTGRPQLRKTYKTLNDDIALAKDIDDLIVIDQPTTGICHGDSGGPVFIEADHELQVAGVNSFVANLDKDDSRRCHDVSGATYMPPHRTWLSEVTGLNFN